jgi:hypothetical protein
MECQTDFNFKSTEVYQVLAAKTHSKKAILDSKPTNEQQQKQFRYSVGRWNIQLTSLSKNYMDVITESVI